MLLLALVACPTPETKDTGATTPGPGGGGADMPAYCEETGREPVADPTVPATGFDLAAQDVVDALTGTLTGTYTPYTGEPSALTLTIAPGAVEAVTYTLVDPDGGDTGVGLGAPTVSDCPPAYAIAADVGFATEDGAFAESFSTTMLTTAVDAARWDATIELADVGGTARPADIVPADWDRVYLQVDAYTQDGGWAGSLTWQATNDAADAKDDTTTGTGSTGTGTVGVSGMSEGAGGWTAAR